MNAHFLQAPPAVHLIVVQHVYFGSMRRTFSATAPMVATLSACRVLLFLLVDCSTATKTRTVEECVDGSGNKGLQACKRAQFKPVFDLKVIDRHALSLNPTVLAEQQHVLTGRLM